jgi:hypothetical protein
MGFAAAKITKTICKKHKIRKCLLQFHKQSVTVFGLFASAGYDEYRGITDIQAPRSLPEIITKTNIIGKLGEN